MKNQLIIILTAFLVALASCIAEPIPNVNSQRRDLSGFSICSKNGDSLELKSLTYSPNPVTAGRPLVIEFKGALRDAITQGAYIHITAYALWFKVLDENIDFCSSKGVSCPVQPGADDDLVVSFDIPSAAPPISVHLTATVVNGNGQEIVCIDNTSFKI